MTFAVLCCGCAENLNINTGAGSMCYNDNNSYCDKYGRLYTWNAAKTVCPSGIRTFINGNTAETTRPKH
ncbi:MAG: hypothetical protein LBB74_00995 [Chitinispirillales bacterium]|nr:hypothetical protein [Chitinispirillales bacterium]